MSFKTITNQALVAVIVMLALVGVPYLPLNHAAQLAAQPVLTQTLTQTTLNGAVTNASSSNSIILTSATGVVAGYRLVVITGGQVEAMDVDSSWVSGTTIPVKRGIAGTARYAHNSGDVVFIQRPALFYSDPLSGAGTGAPKVACSSSTSGTGASAVTISNTTATPYVSLPSGNVFYCVGGTSGQWVQTLRNGFTMGASGGTHAIAYTAAGALYTVPGLHTIGTAGALAMTLAPPTKDEDGIILVITATTAQAHTVTYTAGFSQNTTSSDVCTFGGAINDGMVIYADTGVWRISSTRNVTCA